jgi:hypothetical protein
MVSDCARNRGVVESDGSDVSDGSMVSCNDRVGDEGVGGASAAAGTI